ncbi:MAG TPA: hypothetical protein VFQ53_18340 [Kofleriaceae bacterium]|nr:hypothetical protein [Kofleriaceae bacterium]
MFPRVVTSAAPHPLTVLASAAALGTLAGVLAVAIPPPGPDVLAPPAAAWPGEETIAVARSIRTHDREPPVSTRVHLVFAIDEGSYMELGLPPGATVPARPLAGRISGLSPVADLEPRDVPDAQRAWLGRSVRIEDACTARVAGFSLVRLVRDPEDGFREDGVQPRTFAPGELRDATLVARLEGCGFGSVARDAMLPPVIAGVYPDPAQAPELHGVFATWTAYRERFAAHFERDQDARFDARTVHVADDAATGTRFAIVEASFVLVDCAPPDVMWRAFRIAADGTRTELAHATDLAPRRLFVVDGVPVVLGDRGHDRVLMRLDGKVVAAEPPVEGMDDDCYR